MLLLSLTLTLPLTLLLTLLWKLPLLALFYGIVSAVAICYRYGQDDGHFTCLRPLLMLVILLLVAVLALWAFHCCYYDAVYHSKYANGLLA